MDEHESFLFGPYRLFPVSRRLFKEHEAIVIGSRAFDLLALLVRRRGEVVSRRQILRHVWPELIVDETNLRAQIAQLRQLLREHGGDETYVANVRGRGYVFVAPVQHLAHMPAISPPREDTRPLPARPQRLIGREHTLDVLAARLQAHRSVTIIGPDSIGKTAVAIELGHRLAAHLDGGSCYVALRAQASRKEIETSICAALGEFSPCCPSFQRQILLILDGCGDVVTLVRQVVSVLLRNAPQVRILATSRTALGLEDEFVEPLVPLQLPRLADA